MLPVEKAPAHAAASQSGLVLLLLLAFEPVADTSRPTLYALQAPQERLVVPPEYLELCPLRSDVALGKHHLSKQWERLDLDSGQRTALPFDELVRVRSGRRPNDGPTRWVGATGQQDGRWTIVLLSEDGHAVSTLPDVAGKSFEEGPQPLDYLPGGGYVVHFDPVGEEAFDRIYNVDGFAASPPLPPLLRMLGDAEQAPVILHAIVLDQARGLCWPVLDDGSIMPKPDDALGLRPLPDTTSPQGWAAGWQTAAGERWAILPRFRIEGRELLASREQACFTDVACQPRKARGGEGFTLTRATWIARDAATGTTMAYDARGAELQPILAMAASSMAAAAREVLQLSTAATRTARAEVDNRVRLAQEEEARRVAALEIANREARKRRDAQLREIDRLLAERSFAKADEYAWQIGSHAEVFVHIADAAKGSIDQLSLGTLNVASRLGANQDLFRNAFRARVAALNAASSPQQFGDSGASGSSTHDWQPSKYTGSSDVNSSKRIFDNMRQQSMDNYLSGKQSWYFSGNSSTRR